MQRFCAHLAFSGLMKSAVDSEHIKIIHSELQAQNNALKGRNSEGQTPPCLFLLPCSPDGAGEGWIEDEGREARVTSLVGQNLDLSALSCSRQGCCSVQLNFVSLRARRK